jgi:hypothetical protein
MLGKGHNYHPTTSSFSLGDHDLIGYFFKRPPNDEEVVVEWCTFYKWCYTTQSHTGTPTNRRRNHVLVEGGIVTN